jgi:hypothetical protein
MALLRAFSSAAVIDVPLVATGVTLIVELGAAITNLATNKQTIKINNLFITSSLI